MRRSPLSILAAVACVLVVAAVAGHTAHRATAQPGDTLEIPESQLNAGLCFAPTVAPADRAWILAAIAGAQPGAQRLIAKVDGLVTIDTSGSYPAMGLTRFAHGAFRIWLNLPELDGERAIDRPTVVLHELGHVVDIALVPSAMDRQLDAGIPRGTSCQRADGFDYGSCAAPEERFADTFAKWALGGAVSAVGAGYGIPTPPSLETWAAPLAML